MEWLTKINCAMDYLEANLAGNIDYDEAAKIACCSLPRFQNVFMFITDITLSEYVRRRRMSLSAGELVKKNIKIIELSHKYGYESPEAYTRAFKSFHGISPSVARKYGKYIDYPPITFSLIIKGGHFAMGTNTQFETYKDILIKMETVELPQTFKFAGLTSKDLPNFQNIEVFHEKYKPSMEKQHTPYTEVGFASDICKDGGWYIFGCQVNSIDSLPDGLVGIDTGLNKFACLTFRVQPGHDLVGGEDGPGDGMQRANEYLLNEWVPKNKHKLYGYVPDEQGCSFHIKKSEKDYKIVNLETEGLEDGYTIYSWFEVYKEDIQKEPEMCYYIPLL